MTDTFVERARELADECAMEEQTSNEAMMISALRECASRIEELERGLALKEALAESWRTKCLEARELSDKRYEKAVEWQRERDTLRQELEQAKGEVERLRGIESLVREFAEGRLDYGDITAPTARYALLERMFHTMRLRARAALAEAGVAGEGE